MIDLGLEFSYFLCSLGLDPSSENQDLNENLQSTHVSCFPMPLIGKREPLSIALEENQLYHTR